MPQTEKKTNPLRAVLGMGLLFFLTFLIYENCFEIDPEEQKREEDALLAELKRSKDDICGSNLELINLPIGGWRLTCDGCSLIPASELLPPDAMADLEFIQSRTIMLADFLRRVGECPYSEG